MYKTFVKITLITMLLTPLFPQVSSGGVPKSIQAGLSTVVTSLILPHVDKDALLMEDKIENKIKIVINIFSFDINLI